MKRNLGFVIIVAITLLTTPLLNSSVSAHILVKSDTSPSNAIVHIVPDDDPIAGEPSDIFFDINSKDNDDIQEYSLVIRSEEGTEESVDLVKYEDSNYRSNYIFNSQGLYRLTLNVGNDRFTFSQRVSRGAFKTHSTEKLNNSWAEAGLIGSSCLILVILILITNRRGQILAFTYDEPKRSLNEAKDKKSK